jgi:hypothetical protein
MRIFQSEFETILFTSKGNAYIIESMDFPTKREFEETNLNIDDITKNDRYRELDVNKLLIILDSDLEANPNADYDLMLPKFIYDEQ